MCCVEWAVSLVLLCTRIRVSAIFSNVLLVVAAIEVMVAVGWFSMRGGCFPLFVVGSTFWWSLFWFSMVTVFGGS